MSDITTLGYLFSIHSWLEHFLRKFPSLLNSHPFSQPWSWSTHFSISTYILLITFLSSPSYLSQFTISTVWWLSPSPRLRSRWGLSLLPGSESQFVVCVMYVCKMMHETWAAADREEFQSRLGNDTLTPQKKVAAPGTDWFQEIHLEQEIHQIASNETRCEILSFVFPPAQVCCERCSVVITETH